MGRSSPNEDPRIFCDLLAIEGFESPSQIFLSSLHGAGEEEHKEGFAAREGAGDGGAERRREGWKEGGTAGREGGGGVGEAHVTRT